MGRKDSIETSPVQVSEEWNQPITDEACVFRRNLRTVEVCCLEANLLRVYARERVYGIFKTVPDHPYDRDLVREYRP